MNFKKLLLIVVPLMALFFGYLYYTRLDHADPIAVANAFTKALKSGDVSAASSYYVPDQAAAWKTATSESLDKLKSGAIKGFYDGIPETPGFTSANSKSAAGTLSLQSSDKLFNLEMSKLAGNWYVAKAPI